MLMLRSPVYFCLRSWKKYLCPNFYYPPSVWVSICVWAWPFNSFSGATEPGSSEHCRFCTQFLIQFRSFARSQVCNSWPVNKVHKYLRNLVGFTRPKAIEPKDKRRSLISQPRNWYCTWFMLTGENRWDCSSLSVDWRDEWPTGISRESLNSLDICRYVLWPTNC